MTDVVRAEWLKIRSVRFTASTMTLTLVLGAALSLLVSLSFRAGVRDGSRERQEFDPIFASFYGLTLAQLAVVVFGVLVVGSEFSSGTIRTSLAATPQRGRFYAGKVVAVAVPVVALSLITVAAAFTTAQLVLGPEGMRLGDDGVGRAVSGGVLYLPLICLFAVGVAAILGSSMRALAVLLPIFFLGSQGLGNVPQIRAVLQYLPDQAGTMILHMAGPPDDLVFDRSYGPWTGVGILALWTAAALVGGWLALRRRDV